MDIFQLLTSEHEVVAGLFRRLLDDREDRIALFRELSVELMSHAEAEEHTFYEYLRDADGFSSMMDHAEDEHHLAEALVGEAQEALFDDELFFERIEALQEKVLEHVAEEEGAIFARARQVIDDVVAQAIAGEFMAEKEEWKKRHAQTGGLLGKIERLTRPSA
jgi:hemerythrin superfamily protein